MKAFRPSEHIRARADFERVYKTGQKLSGRLMMMFTRERDTAPSRLGIAATRKMGGAVERNRAKRLARELFRHHKYATSLDIVVVPRREMLEAPYASLEAEFRALLDRRRGPGRAGVVDRVASRAAADPRV